jgi:hypothetical protein
MTKTPALLSKKFHLTQSNTVSMTEQATPSFLVNVLSDDLLGNILLYNDFETVARFRLVSKSVCRRLHSPSPKSTLHRLWRLMYDRQYFAPVENSLQRLPSQIDFFSEIQKRRRLLFQLLQHKRSNKHNRCFNLPNRFFYFKPLVPTGFQLEDGEEDTTDPNFNDPSHRAVMDPPKFIFEYDSFVLMPGTSDDLFFLDPFDASLSVISNFASTLIPPDEATIDRAMFAVGGEDSGHSFKSPKKVLQNSFPQSQELLSADDYMTFDVASYFPDHETDPNVIATEEFDMNFVGIDSKPIVDATTNTLNGSVVAVARLITNFQDESMICSEVIMWAKKGMGDFDKRVLCRFPYPFGTVDFDPVKERLFVSVAETSRQAPFNHRTVVVYPMMPWNGNGQNYFASPIAEMQCDFRISYLMSDVSGETLLVATHGGTIEVWDTSTPYKKLSNINVVASLGKAIKLYIEHQVWVLKSKSSKLYVRTPRQRITSVDDGSGSSTSSYTSEAHTASFSVLRQQLSLRAFQQPVEAIYIPKHLSANQAGFLTLQHHPEEGSNLLLWRPSGNENFAVVSRINLSLLSRRRPCISFDGNRLIVFGEDHIGPIILVYAVCNADYFLPEDCSTGEQSGGVYNLTNPPQVRFANRIRHVALGGIDKLDSIHMTTNERFIIVNTKTGNLLNETFSPFSEGLLVIDLQDQGRW